MDSKFNGIIGGMSEPARIVCTNHLPAVDGKCDCYYGNTAPCRDFAAMEQANDRLEAASNNLEQVLSNSMTIHALEAEVLAMVPELRQSVLMDEFNTQNHETREQVYAAADAKVRPIYLQILELLAKAHGFESYEAALEAQAQAECERADEKFYGEA